MITVENITKFLKSHLVMIVIKFISKDMPFQKIEKESLQLIKSNITSKRIRKCTTGKRYWKK
jgi:hypothetical protein